jgi:aspartate/tyrosine/aromatic aminotransferase
LAKETAEEKALKVIDLVIGVLKDQQAELGRLIQTVSASHESPIHPQGQPVMIRCKRWEEFKALAAGAEMVSFLFKETEKAFQADALKEGSVLAYSGEIPRDANLLKFWLSKELGVPEEKVFEGILTTG